MAAVLLVKPFPRDTVDEEEVRAFCRSESETEGVYVPGSRMNLVLLVDNEAATMMTWGDQRLEANEEMRMHTICDICCTLETLIGTANLNRLALSSCSKAGVSNKAATAVGGVGVVLGVGSEVRSVDDILPAREARAAGRRKERIMGCQWRKGRFNLRVSLESEVVAAVVVVGIVCGGADGERKEGEKKRGER